MKTHSSTSFDMEDSSRHLMGNSPSATPRSEEHERAEATAEARVRAIKCLMAEFIGTFMLCSTISYAAGQQNMFQDNTPLAIGMTLLTQVFAFGHVSGAHFNPAITLAVYIRGKIEGCLAIWYVIVQVIAAFLAGLLAQAVMKDAGMSAGYPSPHMKVGWGTVFVVEMIYTFALASVVLNVATTKAQENNSFFGLAIGATIIAAVASGGALSGGAFNPAVGTGLPLAHGDAKWVWVYWVAPCTGSILAAVVFRITAHPSEFETNDTTGTRCC